MIRKLLIANRGEIACRIQKTARRLGVATVAVYSDADRNALHVRLADEACYIGESPPSASYLDVERVLAAAKEAGADAIHPGYGFLSENADFAERCRAAGLTFVGPPAAAIATMGSKSAAKQAMATAGVPLLPGYHGSEQDVATLQREAASVGYPVLLKAVAGGGGKGMRVVSSDGEFSDALDAAKREAVASFGNDAMLVEKYLQAPRHIEVQVFFDGAGNGVYLFERDCSLQRRHQKVIEEAPAPGLTTEQRTALGEAAVKAGAAVDYEGAGTVEFLLDVDGSFYFMEMNTRLQVEHPVTELITGCDLVEWQLQVASGESLPVRQDELAIDGHALEARLYAEDVDAGFLPQSGRLDNLRLPRSIAGVRVDTGVETGDEISIFYDPMIAKVIAWGSDRTQAIERLRVALADIRVAGVTTNERMLYALISHPAFRAAELSTGFIDDHANVLAPSTVAAASPWLVAGAVARFFLTRQSTRRLETAAAISPWRLQDGFRVNRPDIRREVLTVAGHDYTVSLTVAPLAEDRFRFVVDAGDKSHVAVAGYDGDGVIDIETAGRREQIQCLTRAEGCRLFAADGAMDIGFADLSVDALTSADVTQATRAPMTGTVVAINVKPGEHVDVGQTLLVVEAMKMEHPLKAAASGVVSAIYCEEGATVQGDQELLAFDAVAD